MPPQRYTKSELEYLACVIENGRWAQAWEGYLLDVPRKELIKQLGTTNVGNLSSYAWQRIEQTARHWGWGIDSVENRRVLARTVAGIAVDLGDGNDEMMAAARALVEARDRHEEARRASAQARARTADAAERVEQAKQAAMDVARRLLRKIDRGL